MRKFGLCFGLVAAIAASFCTQANAQECCDGTSIVYYDNAPVITQSYVGYPVTWNANVVYRAPMYRSTSYRMPIVNRFRQNAFRPVIWQTPVVHENPVVYDSPVVWQVPTSVPCCG